MDDGQILCGLGQADQKLRCIDEESLKAGLERGRGDKAKSVCRLIGPAEHKVMVHAGWYTDYIKESSVASPENDLEGHVLGIDFDNADGASVLFVESVRRAVDARKQTKNMDDIPCELAAMQGCLGVCKTTHLLRGAGLYINTPTLHGHGVQLKNSLADMLGCEISVESRTQTACGVRNGGLGLRRTEDLALPAFIASRTDSRNAVASLVHELFDDKLGDSCLNRFDVGLESAICKLKGRLSLGHANEVEACS